MLVTLGLIVSLFLPMGYMSGRFWFSTRDASNFVSAEQRGLPYVRAVTGLLAELCAAQSAAVHRKPLNVAGLRTAVEDVNRLNRRSGDPLQIERRWADLAKLIDTVLKQNASGQRALSVYAAPIGLTQSLLGQIGDSSRIIRDPGFDAYYLMDTALARVPEVIVSEGQVDALAPQMGGVGGEQGTVSRIAVAQDRVAKATEAINVGLRTGADATMSDSLGRDLLRPLDEFVAAVDAMAKASTELTLGTGAAPGEIDAAHQRVHKATLALDSAVLDELGSLLDQRGDELAAERRTALIATVLGLVAAALLLWFLLPSAATSRAPGMDDAEAHEDSAGHEWVDTDDRRPDEPDRETDLMDARELLAPELVHVGRGVQAKHRRQQNDPR
jgi:hypothetical protein